MWRSPAIIVSALIGWAIATHAASAQMPLVPAAKAVAFDYFVLFDANSLGDEAEAVFPGRGADLAKLWRGKMFEYNFITSIAHGRADFAELAEASLIYAAQAMKLDLTDDRKRALFTGLQHLKPWPDTSDALRKLRAAGVRVIALSNFTPEMLRANADHAGLSDLFDDLVSTKINGSFKPDPRAYQLGLDRLGLKREDVVFAAFGGWDAYGAKSFGYRTIWVNRFDLPEERLQPAPDRAVRDLGGLLQFVLGG